MGAGGSAVDRARSIRTNVKRKALDVLTTLHGGRKSIRYEPHGEQSGTRAAVDDSAPTAEYQLQLAREFLDVLAACAKGAQGDNPRAGQERHMAGGNSTSRPGVVLRRELLEHFCTKVCLRHEDSGHSRMSDIEVLPRIASLVDETFTSRRQLWQALVMYACPPTNPRPAGSDPTFANNASTEGLQARDNTVTDPSTMDSTVPGSDMSYRDWLHLFTVFKFLHRVLCAVSRGAQPLIHSYRDRQVHKLSMVMTAVYQFAAEGHEYGSYRSLSLVHAWYDVMDLLCHGLVTCSHVILPPLSMPDPHVTQLLSRQIEQVLLDRLCTGTIPFLSRSLGILLASVPMYRIQDDLLTSNSQELYLALLMNDTADLESKITALTALRSLLPTCPGLWHHLSASDMFAPWLSSVLNDSATPYRLRVEVAALLGSCPATSTSAVEYLRPIVSLCENAQGMMRASGGTHSACEIAMDTAKILRTLALVALASRHARDVVLGHGLLHDIENMLHSYPVHGNPDACTSHVVVHELLWCQLYYLVTSLYIQAAQGVIPHAVQPPSDLYLSESTRQSFAVAIKTKNRHSEYLLLPLIAESKWYSDGQRDPEIVALLSSAEVFDTVLKAHACNYLSTALWDDLSTFQGIQASSDSHVFLSRLLLPHQAESSIEISVPRFRALYRTVLTVYDDVNDVPTDVVSLFQSLLWNSQPALVTIGRKFWTWMRHGGDGYGGSPSRGADPMVVDQAAPGMRSKEQNENGGSTTHDPDAEAHLLLGELLSDTAQLFQQRAPVVLDRQSLADYGGEGENDMFQQQLQAMRKMYDRPDYCVAFCGAFNSGKSTLINALCQVSPSYPYLLPTHWVECTSMLIEVMYGRETRAPELVFSPTLTGHDILHMVQSHLSAVSTTPLVDRLREHSRLYEGSSLPPLTLTRDQYTRIVDVQQDTDKEQDLILQLCDAIRVFYPCDLLHGGLRFIDCPGSMKNKERSKLTKNFLETEADTIVYVTPAVGGWLSEDRDLLTSLQGKGKRIVIVNSKFDQATQSSNEKEARELVLTQAGSKPQQSITDKIFFVAVPDAARQPISYDLHALKGYLADHISNDRTTLRTKSLSKRLATLLQVFSDTQAPSAERLLSLKPDEIDTITSELDTAVGIFVGHSQQLHDKLGGRLEEFQGAISAIIQNQLQDIITNKVDDSWVSLVKTANPDGALRQRFMHEVLQAITDPVQRCIEEYSDLVNQDVIQHVEEGKGLLHLLDKVLNPSSASGNNDKGSSGVSGGPLDSQGSIDGSGSDGSTLIHATHALDLWSDRSNQAGDSGDLISSGINWDLAISERNIWRHERGSDRILNRRNTARAVLNFVLSEEGLSATSDAKTYFDVVFSSLTTAALPTVARACIAGSAAVVGTVVLKIIPKIKAVRSGAVSVFKADLLSHLPTISDNLASGIWRGTAQGLIEEHVTHLQQLVTYLVRPLQLAKIRVHGDVQNAEKVAAFETERATIAYALWQQAHELHCSVGTARRRHGKERENTRHDDDEKHTLSLQEARFASKAITDHRLRQDEQDGVWTLDPSSPGPGLNNSGGLDISHASSIDTSAHVRFQTFLYQQEVKLQNDDWSLLANRLSYLDPEELADAAGSSEQDSEMRHIVTHDTVMPPLVLTCAELCLVISDMSERVQKWGRLAKARVLKSTFDAIQARLSLLSYTLVRLCPGWDTRAQATGSASASSPAQRLHSLASSASSSVRDGVQVTLPWFACRSQEDTENRITIVISGTKRLRDLFISAQCLPTSYQYGETSSDSISVHSGIYLSARAVFQELCDTGIVITNDTSTNEASYSTVAKTRYVLTGHSVGGAVAMLLAMFIRNEAHAHGIVDAIHAYGSPRFLHGDIELFQTSTVANLDTSLIHVLVHPRDIVPCLFGSSNARLAIMLWQQVSTLGAGLPAFLQVCANYQPCGHLWVVRDGDASRAAHVEHGPQTREAPEALPCDDIGEQRRRLELLPRHLSPAGVKSHFMNAYVQYIKESMNDDMQSL